MQQTAYPPHSGYHGAPKLMLETGSVFFTCCHAPMRVTFLAMSSPSLPTSGAYITAETITSEVVCPISAHQLGRSGGHYSPHLPLPGKIRQLVQFSGNFFWFGFDLILCGTLFCINCMNNQWTIPPLQIGLDVMQSYPLCRTHLGQYQASSDALDMYIWSVKSELYMNVISWRLGLVKNRLSDCNSRTIPAISIWVDI